MSTERKNEEFEGDYLPGQLDFYTELFERGPGKGKKRKHPASKLDDVAFLFDPAAGGEEGEEEYGEFSLGSDW